MGHSPRLPRDVYVGYGRALVTICTHNRQPHFADLAVVELVRAEFFFTADQLSQNVAAYCFMPNHVHTMIEGAGEQADCWQFVKLAKQRSGFRCRRRFGVTLWQSGYHDRVLRKDEPAPIVMRYIIENPVRAGLVQDVRQYPAWGSQRHSRDAMLEFIGRSVPSGAVSWRPT